MKNLFVTTVTILAASTVITACVTTHDSTSIKQIREAKLADGSTTRYGFTPVLPEWKCKQIYRKTSTTGLNNLKGSFAFGGPYQVMLEDAIQFANKSHLKPNYIFLYSPTQNQIAGLNLSAMEESSAIYYQCKQPPALTNKIF